MAITPDSFERSERLRSYACGIGVERIQFLYPLVRQPFGGRLQHDLARLREEHDNAVLDDEVEALVNQ